jgi:DNA-binding CsgD family transcriptional regulator
VSAAPSVPALLGRETECGEIDLLLTDARAGSSGALVLWGEPGIGKSALLDYAVEAASDLRVLRSRGSDSALGLRYAGLRLLLEPLLSGLGALPEPQQAALAAALELTTSDEADDFLVSLATLTLLSNASGDRGLLCAVDDAHWLDDASAGALAFAGARLDREGVALLLASDLKRDHRFLDLPRLHVSAVDDQAAGQLIERGLSGAVDAGVLAILVSELRGNPLALLELPGELSVEQLAGTSALPDPLPLGGRLEERLLRLVHALPLQTQLLLLVAAAEPGGDWPLLQRAADQLGMSAGAVDSVRQTGLLEAGDAMRFRHSFTRLALYSNASAPELQRVHGALAEATDRKLAPDRRAWHLGAAATGPDAAVAEELEIAAGPAIGLRGYAAAAKLLVRAADLSPDESQAAARRLAGARATLAAGSPERAAALLELAAPSLVGELAGAQALRLRGQLALALGENGHTAGLLLQAAEAFEPLDRRIARDTHLEALAMALFAGRLAARGAALESALAARAAPRPASGAATSVDFLLDGLAALVIDGHAESAPAVGRALGLLRDHGELQWVGLGGHVAAEHWDDEAMHALASRRVRLARETGALAVLPNALSQLGGYELTVGRFDAAAARFDEARSIAASTGNPGLIGAVDGGVTFLAAWRGEPGRARSLAHAHARDASARGVGVLVNLSFLILAVLENGLGGYAKALTAAQEAVEGKPFWVTTRTLPELVEAAIRSGRRDVAEQAVEQLAQTVLPRSTEWGLGMLSRSRALLAADGDAAELYVDAIDHLRRCRAVPELGRARLLYGEWLRRGGKRKQAREELGLAFELFDSMGAGAFAERAATELAATGARVRARKPESVDVLTPHEWRIASLAIEGASNSDIAAQLFISPRTVEYHLHKIFRKLGISSRTRLRGALEARSSEPSQD